MKKPGKSDFDATAGRRPVWGYRIEGYRYLPRDPEGTSVSVLLKKGEDYKIALIDEGDLRAMLDQGVVLFVDPTGPYHRAFVKIERGA
jgi:hypothetical protein